ncbi:MAG: hypothetical protein IJ668_06585 [Selenomonadaceae bacterium]|nr:hypothetical protein [Selenomonadaceae bacterium]MBR1580147.1 hypothetical protein [Selenomonadaceae bacterium]
MDIAPVNIQMVYPTAATEASNVQHNLNQATNLQQDFESLRQRQDDELKQKQVRNKNEADQGGTIKDEPDRRGRGGYQQRQSRRRNPQPDQPQAEKFAVDPMRGHRLDISL